MFAQCHKLTIKTKYRPHYKKEIPTKVGWHL
jgi:hypothetical protein